MLDTGPFCVDGRSNLPGVTGRDYPSSLYAYQMRAKRCLYLILSNRCDQNCETAGLFHSFHALITPQLLKRVLDPSDIVNQAAITAVAVYEENAEAEIVAFIPQIVPVLSQALSVLKVGQICHNHWIERLLTISSTSGNCLSCHM